MKHIKKFSKFESKEIDEFEPVIKEKLPKDLEEQIKDILSDMTEDMDKVVLYSEDTGNSYIISLDEDRNITNIEISEEKNESLENLGSKAKKAITKGVILLVLAGGLVSCATTGYHKKPNRHMGKNVGLDVRRDCRH